MFPANGLGLVIEHHREGIPGTAKHDFYRVFREGTADPHPDSTRADRALPGDMDTHLDTTPQRNAITHHHAERYAERHRYAEQHANGNTQHHTQPYAEPYTDFYRQLVVIYQQRVAGS